MLHRLTINNDNNNIIIEFYKFGITPLHISTNFASGGCAELLLSHGAELNTSDRVSNDNNMNGLNSFAR